MASTDLEPASLLRRFAAFCYDLLLLAALLFSFTLAIVALRLGEPVPPGSLWFPLCLLAIAIAFFCGSWVRGGQTVGMRAWRIRIVTNDGGAVGWLRAGARFCVGIVALAPAGLGFWWAARDSRKRGWHDLWTGTRIVRAVPRS
jgi:uncharacterized RDD family membrane protein YckC